MKNIISVIFVLFIAAQFLYAVSVTIYNNDLALVRDTKNVKLTKGVQNIELDEVAAKIDPTSVLPKFLSNANKIKILEQNFDFDLVNTDKLLSKYIGETIEIERTGEDKRGKLTGKLLSAYGGLVVQNESKIVLNPQGEISLSKLPEDLKLKPTLIWLVESETEGNSQIEISYQTGGISWNADYVLVTNEKDTAADITGWVTINNNSGAVFKDAKLKLIAGDINRVSQNKYAQKRMMAPLMAEAAAVDSSFEEKSFFEYHMYELQRKSTLKDREIKQIQFISAKNIPVKKVFTYNADIDPVKIKITLDLKNSKENNLGIPLPKGRVRVSKYDSDSIEFIGEDSIDHTAKDAKLSINIGNAFDITGKKIQTNSKTEGKTSYQSFSINIKNSKNTSVDVNVEEMLNAWSNWEIKENSVPFVKKDKSTIEFSVNIPANTEKEIKYTVKYWWK
ncbi:MAG: hypothetical protein PHI20_00905 [Endomicrobiaceae bacterium]|jgi:hypothetical protein|nr:hypothetical protein [Endomicrobiaceae bacterium]